MRQTAFLVFAPLLLPALGSAAPASLPLAFEENRGQSAPEVNFLAPGFPGIFFTPKEAVIVFDSGNVLRIQPEHALPSRPEALEPLPGQSHYLNREPPITGVRQYARIRYRSVYPGIDVVYHGRPSQLEYDFDVAPGARPGRVRLRLQGARQLHIDTAGNLVARLSNITFVQRNPRAWQQVGSLRRDVDVRYLLIGKQEVAFAIGAYDRTRPLIIDPLIDYVTDLGSTATDPFHLGTVPYAIAADSAGNAYITGDAPSGSFTGPPGTTPMTGNTGFVAKLSADGTQLLYSSYLNLPMGQAIAVDTEGSAYVGGPNYVVKLTPDGSAFAYDHSFPTPLGGTSVSHLLLDSAANLYVSGSTFDYKFPTTPGAYQSTFIGQVGLFGANIANGFLMKLNPAGSVVYSTYLRDPLNNVLQLFAVDPAAQNPIIVTVTSPSGPSQPYVNSLLKLNASGSQAILTASYQGPDPTMPIIIKGIATDSSGDLFLEGDGPGFGTQVGSSAWFLAELNPSGALISSGHIPFSGDLHIDAAGNAYIVAALRNDNALAETPTVARVGNSFSSVTTSQLTGAITDQIQSDTADSAGNVYVVLVPGGVIGSPPQLPATPGAYQPTGGGFAVLKADAVGLSMPPPPPPIPGLNAITNAASGLSGMTIAPDEILAIYGVQFGPTQLVAATLDANGNFPTSLAGTTVTIGGQPVPLLYTSPSQIGAITPASLVGTTTLQVAYQGVILSSVPQIVVYAIPGLFTADESGHGQGAVVNQDGSINSTSHPAAPGSVVSLYCSGCGVTIPPGADGAIASSPVLLANPATVTIGGQSASVLYAGSAPDLVNGAVQINVMLPAGMTGDAVPVTVSISGAQIMSPPVTIVVHP